MHNLDQLRVFWYIKADLMQSLWDLKGWPIFDLTKEISRRVHKRVEYYLVSGIIDSPVIPVPTQEEGEWEMDLRDWQIKTEDKKDKHFRGEIFWVARKKAPPRESASAPRYLFAIYPYRSDS